MNISKKLIASVGAAALLVGVMPLAAAAPVAAAITPLKVLIIGDSYSAGNGAGNYYGAKDCYRSTTTWGERLGAKLEAELDRPVETTNRACSGAVSRDLVGGTTADPEETDRRLNVDNFYSHAFWARNASEANSKASAFCSAHETNSPDEYWTGQAERDTLNFYHPRCSRYLRSEITSVNPSYDLVVMTLGGNDAGFADIGADCLVLIKRDGKKCEKSLTFAENLVKRTGRNGMRDRLVRVMNQVHARLNPVDRTTQKGQVLLLSYPSLISNDGYTLDGVKVGVRLRAVAARADAIQREVMGLYNDGSGGVCARKTSIFADGTKAAFGNHGVSAPINVNGSDDWWLWEVVLPTAVTLHPKPIGHAAEADAAFSAAVANGASGCATANSFVLNRQDNGSEGPNLEATLLGVGDVVARGGTLPEDLSQFKVIWVVMAYTGLTPDEVQRLSAYVASGGSLYLTGERPCCEALNATSQQVINNVIKLPDIQVGGLGDINGTFAPNFAAAGDIAVSPQRLIDFQPSAPGAMAGLGNLTGRNVLVSNGEVPVAGVWDEADMTTGKGRIVILMDIDWLGASERSQYVINVHEFLAR